MASTPPNALELDQDLARVSMDGEFSVSWTHRLRFTRHALREGNDVLASVLPNAPEPTRMLAVFDQGLINARPGLLSDWEGWVARHPDRVSGGHPPVILPGGEVSKNGWEAFETTIKAIAESHLCRRSIVVIFGGGAVLDAAGFAAATAHRGMGVIRFPSTTLAQGDAGIGVKNAINAMGVKNFLGTFSPPVAGVNDTTLLDSLDDVHWRSGLSEAIKVAALKDPGLLDQIERDATLLCQRDLDAMERTLITSARLHMDHIVAGGDPFETRHARPLDLGHWSAHRMEALSGWTMPHGDAVALGLVIDLVYASAIGRLDAAVAGRLVACLQALGFPMTSPLLDDVDALLAGLQEFREHLGGRLTVPLVADVGRPDEVHEIDTDVMRASIESIRRGELPPR